MAIGTIITSTYVWLPVSLLFEPLKYYKSKVAQ